MLPLNLQDITRARRGKQGRAGALALQHRIGGHRGSENERADLVGADPIAVLQLVETCEDRFSGIAGHRRNLEGLDLAGLETEGRDVGEGPAPVDPEVPAAHAPPLKQTYGVFIRPRGAGNSRFPPRRAEPPPRPGPHDRVIPFDSARSEG